MAVTAQDRTDLELAHTFARAYREVDREALRRMLAPDVRNRVLAPPGYKELDGPEAAIAELRDLTRSADEEIREIDLLHDVAEFVYERLTRQPMGLPRLGGSAEPPEASYLW